MCFKIFSSKSLIQSFISNGYSFVPNEPPTALIIMSISTLRSLKILIIFLLSSNKFNLKKVMFLLSLIFDGKFFRLSSLL